MNNVEIKSSIKTDDGATLGYRLLRQQQLKPLLTLIHGLASNCTRYSEFVEYTHLKERWDLLRVDLRGHGESMYRGRYSRATWINDLNLIMQTEHYQQTVLMGHSLGAQVAITYASQFPDRCRGLILIDPVFPENLSGLLSKAKRYRYVLSIFRIGLRILNRLGIKRWTIPKRDLRALDEQARTTLKEHPELTIADLYTNPLADFKYIPLANYLQDVNEVVQSLPLLENIKAPVLVLLSGGATISSFDKTKEIIDRFPNARIEVVDADHWLLTEKPEETRRIIENWCAEIFN
ncbi:Putative hydrolase [hydrothermal vent metagenome]|uniref:Hydrolase n=1 Tax=hydrothermal vent metagenome TaxID=652676 RepID=A0A3B1AEE4_9ZZZZ